MEITNLTKKAEDCGRDPSKLAGIAIEIGDLEHKIRNSSFQLDNDVTKSDEEAEALYVSSLYGSIG